MKTRKLTPMGHMAKRQKRKVPRPILFLAALLLLTGCTPEEKTLLLPKSQSSEEEAESSPAKDFTVKKIYAYTYTTRDLLMKSAFLEGCGDNEVHIAALDGQDADEMLVFRQVDYRYGFYDTLGKFFRFQEGWFDPAGGEMRGEMRSDLYCSQLLPSPDGTQLLVYIRSALEDTCFIWLYTLGTQEPWLLYEGIHEAGYPLLGSFSPDGCWVTFDAAGVATGGKHLVPVYDCHKDSFCGREDYWVATQDENSSSRFYPPDKMLYTEVGSSQELWGSGLCSYPASPSPALLTVLYDSVETNVFVDLLYKSAEESGLGRDSWAKLQQAGKGRLYLLGTGLDENNKEGNTSSAPDLPDPEPLFHSMAYLFSHKGMPYIQYKYEESKGLLYYMADVFTLSYLNMETLTADGSKSWTFPEPVWDFLPLESGDILVLLVQSSSTGPLDTKQYETNGQSSYPENRYASPYIMQDYWDIQSADLYLYPADGPERHLLYKNVQNLLNMEYDAQNRRILLETYEDGEIGHRKCIILEL